MARRELQEINAGSMADIAFLLLVFFLVTTTLDSDEGILRILPPPVPDDIDLPEVRERDVYVVLVNGSNQLLVENSPMNLNRLKDGAKAFIIGDGVFRDLPTDENLPQKRWVRKTEIEPVLEEYKKSLPALKGEAKANAEALIDNLEKKLAAIAVLKKDYKEMPNTALISLQNDNGTDYKTYIGVQNELQAAVNELREELSLELFNLTYEELEKRATRSEEKELYKARVNAVRQVYPQRISEAEPRRSVSY